VKSSSTLLTLGVVAFLANTTFGIPFPVMPHYAVMMGASMLQVGLVLGAYSYVAGLTMIPFGLLSDRVGRRTPLIASLIIFVLAPLLYPLAGDPQQLIFVRAAHRLSATIFALTRQGSR
jgi:MFS family permease